MAPPINSFLAARLRYINYISLALINQVAVLSFADWEFMINQLMIQLNLLRYDVHKQLWNKILSSMTEDSQSSQYTELSQSGVITID